MRVRTLDVPGLAAGITLYPEISRAGDVMIEFDRGQEQVFQPIRPRAQPPP